MNLKQFNDRMNQYGERVVKNANDGKKATTKALVTELANHTPSDVGTAKSNWLVGVGSARTETIPAHSPGKKGSTGIANAQSTIDAAVGVLGSAKPGQPLFVTNNLPYIDALNAGHSQQAPAGFIELAIGVARSAARGTKLLKE